MNQWPLTLYIHLQYSLCVILWDENKNIKLKLERNISFEDVSEFIISGDIVDVVEHPKRENQWIFILDINGYIYAVPFVIDEHENFILKTVFPSRKLQKQYRGEK